MMEQTPKAPPCHATPRHATPTKGCGGLVEKKKKKVKKAA